MPSESTRNVTASLDSPGSLLVALAIRETDEPYVCGVRPSRHPRLRSITIYERSWALPGTQTDAPFPYGRLSIAEWTSTAIFSVPPPDAGEHHVLAESNASDEQRPMSITRSPSSRTSRVSKVIRSGLDGILKSNSRIFSGHELRRRLGSEKRRLRCRDRHTSESSLQTIANSSLNDANFRELSFSTP